MIAYSMILFAVAIVMIIMGTLVYRGKTELINDYNQQRVSDKKGYGKAIGKLLFITSIPLIISGVMALFTTSILPAVFLLVGLVISYLLMLRVQKRFNGGMF